MLMLIHSLYEAQNPNLAHILGQVLVFAEELYASDMNDLQSVLELGTSACNLESLCLITSISPTEMCLVLATSSTLRNVVLNIGHFDETLVKTVLSKPTTG